MRRLLLAVVMGALAFPAAAGADVPVQPYGTNDFGGFRDVLPSGTNGLTNGPELGAFLANGTRPAHNADQRDMYGDLVYAAPGLKPEDLSRFFKDSTFGVKAGGAERTYSPRADVTIVRDREFGVPHVYGATRAGALFGLGYAAAEDRLFFIDILRHLGRAQLASFAGGAPGNRAFDQMQWQVAPYTEEDLQKQIDNLPVLFGQKGAELVSYENDYVGGINAYIDEAKLNPLKMPGEYAAIGKPQGPDPWKATDIVATASLVGGIFGKGGGEEVDQADLLLAFRKRFGTKLGTRLFEDFRSSQDAEAPTTVKGRSFPYETKPRRGFAKGSVALPDPGSLKRETVAADCNAPTPLTGALGGPCSAPTAMSNALLVSAAKSASGRPLAVFGPQVAYFQPEILMEQDVHAPGWDARGAAFPGVNVIVQLGHGQDYAWSATSAGQDMIDTFALDLCDPGGGAATLKSTGYMFRGQCLPIELLDRTNSWSPTAADSTPAGTETLRAERTKMGLIVARATIGGKPVAYTRLRSTYMHEADSAIGFSEFNDPNTVHDAKSFQAAASHIGYTFNWFYADDKDIAYFNSGNNPVRAPRTDGQLPIRGLPRFEWRGFNPDAVTADYTPPSQHPQVINQSVITSWNNKQAPSFAGDYPNVDGTLYRSQLLDDQLNHRLKGGAKLTLPGVVDAMEEAGTMDLRGWRVLPWALRVIGKPSDPKLADAVAKLAAWHASGAHRRDKDRNGVYDDAEAIRIMDAWWPRWLKAQFEPRLGADLFKRLEQSYEFSNDPNNHGDHLGSAWQDGWYGFAQKDLRTVLKKRVRSRWARRFCGFGGIKRCRAALLSSLADALAHDSPQELYSKDPACSGSEGQGLDPQWCWDSVRFRPLGGATQPLIHWVNRPTYQQVVEVQGHRPR